MPRFPAGHLRLVALAVAWALASLPAAADGWLPTSWFTAAASDPQAMYPLAEKDGPWLVLATTFRGETARDDARQLVHELRSRNKLRAYTHEKAFDYGANSGAWASILMARPNECGMPMTPRCSR